MATELKDMKITFLSLVPRGANKKKIIWKSAADDKDGEAVEREVKLTKVNDEQRMVYGIVYSPDQVDTQGDFAKADEIKKAAYGFMKAALTTNIDANHDFDAKDAYVAESWLPDFRLICSWPSSSVQQLSLSFNSLSAQLPHVKL